MRNAAYLAVDVQGSLLPQDVLSRIAAADRELPGMRPEDYHLAASERLGDAASRRWDYLLGAYRAFRDRLAKLPEGDSATSLTRDRWLLVLLQELGFGRVPYQRGGLQVAGKDFPVSHLWNTVPMHLLGWHTELDKSVPGVSKRAPQSMLQEFLNLSDDHLWGVLSNGRRLRILRDSTSLVGSAYVEFDLEAIFDGELYAEFVLLYTLLHASRFELIAGDDATPTYADCWLEKWRAFAAETGLRARDQLRDGVKDALEALGTGFLFANPKLREQLASGRLSREEFHHELLRLVYQLIFIFVAEDRGALLDPAAPQDAKDRYTDYFSSRRLRRLAVRRSGDWHSDLWRATAMVIAGLGSDNGQPEIALPGLGGLFFRVAGGPPVLTDEPRPDQLLRANLPNNALLTAVRKMCTVRAKDGRPRDVDYQHLGAEELGSIYESLLELVPYAETNGSGPKFELKEKVSGNDRKLTGSYYTPGSLIESLLDTALDPVIEEHATSPDDLLKITVCDPACGSGHFLVAAARRIAKRYAAMVTGEEEPVPSAVREAMRKVVAQCIYGVDINPLAAELAKVSLWIESLEPGKPLAFLDAHIKVGNALLGTTPRLIAAGIPDGAFKPIEGDDRPVASELKKRNAREVQYVSREAGRGSRGSQESLFDEEELPGNQKLAEQVLALAATRVSSVADVREQERRFHELENSDDLKRKRLVADAWCAAFVWRKHADAPEAITTATIRSLEAGTALSDDRAEELRRLVEQYRFFHWHLEFPEVFRESKSGDVNPDTGWSGGFTCVLGNPPWERVKIQEKEFFAGRNATVANAKNAAARKKAIAALATSKDEVDRNLFAEFSNVLRQADGWSLLLRDSGRYPLTGRGDINTYAVFAETGRSITSPYGRVGMVLPTGIATDATTQFFFKDMVTTKTLASLYDFENEQRIFAQVHHSFRFCLWTGTGRRSPEKQINLAFRLRQPIQISDRQFTLTPDDITRLNPNTGTCPVFDHKRNADITIGIYRRVPVLWRDGAGGEGINPWGLSFQAMLHMANDSNLFRPNASAGETLESMLADGWRLEGNLLVRGGERLLPLYESKMVHHFDHRFSTYSNATQAELNVGTLPRSTPEQKNDPTYSVLPQYWVPEDEVRSRLAARSWQKKWLMGWRNIARSANIRTLICGLLPVAGVAHSFPLALVHHENAELLYANLASVVLDFVARQKVAGTNFTFNYITQLAVLPPDAYEQHCPWEVRSRLNLWIKTRMVELSYTAYDMESFARDMGDKGAPFIWDEERRALLRAELDAAFFHLYGIKRDDADYIMETFPIVKRKDEAKYGEYRTKRLILEIYDAMQDAIAGRKPYQTPLDPPPGHGPRHSKRGI
ncbi:Eco57I restriction-modification methylase domain-containing protein [Microbispora sp. H10670]|uniref:Eco57I restriction-modification methylase domain-containing protein n=1 Tax=Microbispora sp. H10670 TaxID=2729108 RepID=UPI0016020EE0|nr:DNA methyltransferase [Microbispora sp. H10670]